VKSEHDWLHNARAWDKCQVIGPQSSPFPSRVVSEQASVAGCFWFGPWRAGFAPRVGVYQKPGTTPIPTWISISPLWWVV
jgi:hypothetical protein